MAAEMWVDDQMIGEWSRAALPKVGDTIGLDMQGEIHEAEVLDLVEVSDPSGTTTRIQLVLTSDP